MAVAQILDENKKYIDQKFIDGVQVDDSKLSIGNGPPANSDGQIILQSGDAGSDPHKINAPSGQQGFYVNPVRSVSDSGDLMTVKYNPNTSEFVIISGT